MCFLGFYVFGILINKQRGLFLLSAKNVSCNALYFPGCINQGNYAAILQITDQKALRGLRVAILR